MSVQPKQKTPKPDPQPINQLLDAPKTAGEIEDLLKDLRKAFIESALAGELRRLLGYEKHDALGRNSGASRNASSRKRIKTDDSEVEIQVPLDRNGEFDPQLIAKHQRRWDGFDETILALYARGMTLVTYRVSCARSTTSMSRRSSSHRLANRSARALLKTHCFKSKKLKRIVGKWRAA